MATSVTPSPGQEEIRQQLARILASSAFRSNQVVGRVLELLVLEALKGKTLTEKDVRHRLFRAAVYQPGTTLVRTHVNKLRRLIQDHYRGDGADDPVLISLPHRSKTKGAKIPSAKVKSATKRVAKRATIEGYPVIFSYNSANRILKMALRFLNEHSPNSLHYALASLDLIIAKTPDTSAAVACRAECLCLKAIYAPESSTVGCHC